MPQLPRLAHESASAEHVEALPRERIPNPRVHPSRHIHGEGRAKIEGDQPSYPGAIQPLRVGEHPTHHPRYARRRARGEGAAIRIENDAMRRQPIGGQVHPAAAPVLLDIAADVRQLHRPSQMCSVDARLVLTQPEDMAHHQPHHAGDAVAVEQQRVEIRVHGPDDVHLHPREELVGVEAWDRATVGDDAERPQHRLVQHSPRVAPIELLP